MSFATTWMNLEIIILSEVRQRQISYSITYRWNLKKGIQMTLVIKYKETYRHRKIIYG